MRTDERSVVNLAERIRAEYLEMPGLYLTRWQMRRLWFLDATLCDAVVEKLVASRFLCRRADGTYARFWRSVALVAATHTIPPHDAGSRPIGSGNPPDIGGITLAPHDQRQRFAEGGKQSCPS